MPTRRVYTVVGVISMTLGVLWIWLALYVFAPMSHLDSRLSVRFEGLPTSVSDEFFAFSIGLVLSVAGLGLLDAGRRQKRRDEEL